MAPRQVKVRGRKRAVPGSRPATGIGAYAGAGARPSETALKAVVRPKRRPKAVPILLRLPLEILERIFVLSANTSLPRSHPVLGQRLSGRGTLVEFAIAVFEPTWAVSVARDGKTAQVRAETANSSTPSSPWDDWHRRLQTLRKRRRGVGVDEAADEAADTSDAALQSDVLACGWATPQLLLDAQQRWLDRCGVHQYRHHFAVLHIQRPWFSYARLLNRQHLQTLAVAHQQQCLRGCPELVEAEAEAEAERTAQWPRSLYTCHALEQATFFEHLFFSCQRVGQANEGCIQFLVGCLWQQPCARVHLRARIPERLLLAGGPYPRGRGHAAEIHRRLYDAFDRLFWLVMGDVQLQRSDSWEVTHEGFQNLLEAMDSDDAVAVSAVNAVNAVTGDVYPTQAVAAGMVVLFHMLRVFSDQWPATVVEAAETAMRVRAGADASFAQSLLCDACMFVFKDLRQTMAAPTGQTGRR